MQHYKENYNNYNVNHNNYNYKNNNATITKMPCLNLTC